MKKGMQNRWLVAAAALGALVLSGGAEENRVAVLEKQMAQMSDELASLKQAQIESGAGDLAILNQADSKVHFGGYGEIHGNFVENGNSTFDIHRLVLYIGYDFADWIKLTSELEIEHAYVKDGAGGYMMIEQLYLDFLFGDAFNVRAGRVLAPLGIVNQVHEPTLFLGVERPNVEKYIIPSTWSLDGIGIFGAPLSWLSYEAYVVGGLDGSKFSADEGIRDGRIKERSGLNDPAITGRLDFRPFVNADLPADQQLRVGVSGYYGGTNNKNKGGKNGVDNDFTLLSADFEYDISRVRLRGVVAHGRNSDAEDLPGANVGSEIFGWYLEGGVSVMPEAWKEGRLVNADIIPFVRYEEYNTQHDVPAGSSAQGANDRQEITIGVNLPLTRQFVVKADYQFLDNEALAKRENQFNLGMGWVFQ